eukprot:IDg20514t1
MHMQLSATACASCAPTRNAESSAARATRAACSAPRVSAAAVHVQVEGSATPRASLSSPVYNRPAT